MGPDLHAYFKQCVPSPPRFFSPKKTGVILILCEQILLDWPETDERYLGWMEIHTTGTVPMVRERIIVYVWYYARCTYLWGLSFLFFLSFFSLFYLLIHLYERSDQPNQRKHAKFLYGDWSLTVAFDSDNYPKSRSRYRSQLSRRGRGDFAESIADKHYPVS